jgi:SNF family Na+-dependent transporter
MTWILAVAGLISAVILPFIIALIQKYEWSTHTKRLIAIITTIVVGMAAAVATGMPTPETLVTFILAVIGAMNLAYALFKKLGITVKWLDALTELGSKTEVKRE